MSRVIRCHRRAQLVAARAGDCDAEYHVRKHDHIAQAFAVGDLNDALRQKSTFSRQTIGQAYAPSGDDIVACVFQATEILIVLVQMASAVEMDVEEVAHDGLLCPQNVAPIGHVPCSPLSLSRSPQHHSGAG
jgi:hypothetical protein